MSENTANVSTDDGLTISYGYQLMSAAEFVSSTGSWMQKVVVGWFVWSTTHSVTNVAILASADLFATLITAPLVGHVIDRAGLYRTILVGSFALAGTALCLAGLLGLGNAPFAALWICVTLDSALQAIVAPARMATAASLAGQSRVSRAIASNSIALNLARSIGPAIAGCMIPYQGGGTAAVVVNAISFLLAGGLIYYMRSAVGAHDHHAQSGEGERTSVSFGYLARNPATFFILIMTLGFVIARSSLEMLPAYVDSVLHLDSKTLGLILSAQGVGALFAASWMLTTRSQGELKTLAFRSCITFSLMSGALLFMPTLWVACMAIFVVGALHVVANVSMQSLVQLGTDPGMRPRISATYNLLFRIGPTLGSGTIGLMAGYLTIAPAAAVNAAIGGAIATLGCVLLYRYTGDGLKQ